MAVAPAAPGAVSLGYFVVGLAALCALGACVGLRFGWRYTFGALLSSLADLLTFKVLGRTVHLGRPFEYVNRKVLNGLHAGIEATNAAAGYFFHGAAVILEWTAGEIVGLARDVLHWGQSLQHVVMPRLTRAMILAAFPYVWLARRVAALVRAHAIPATRTVITRTTRPVVQRVTRIVKAAAGAVVLPGIFWHLFPRVRDLGREVTKLRNRWRQLAYFTTAAGASVLVAKAFTRMGLNWLRCRNVSKVGRGICRMDLGILNFLLGTATAVFALQHLCDLVKYIQRAAVLALPAILALVNETEGYVCGGRASLPSGIEPSDGKRVAALPTGV